MAETSVLSQLYQQIAKDGEKEMEELVLKNDIDINNIQQNGRNTSLLMVATQYNAVKCVRKLIQLGADIEKRHQDGRGGWTVFMYACDCSSDDIAIALVDAGASFSPPEGSTDAPNLRAAVVNAIVERERRAHTVVPTEVEVPKTVSTESWMCMFLTNNGVPEEVAKDCEQKLLGEGFYSPQMLAIMPTHSVTPEYLKSIGIKGRALQYLWLTLQAELYQKRCNKKEALWTQELEEAAKVDKKRGRD